MELNKQDKNVLSIKAFLSEYLDLHRERDNESETIKSIREMVEMKGANIWILIIAIFVASLGLETNSTAVIIGAMLISPLMGPILGMGLSVGLNDVDLMKRSLKSYLVVTLFSVVTSTLFFLIAPNISTGQSELLARTSPTIYDVFIAFFGGMAGFIAMATTKKGSVIPGAAIATALMPPLCTAGYGLATGNLIYFLGAFYLYFINSVFICVSTFLGVRVLKFKRIQFVDKEREKKVRKYIIWVVVLTLIPAVYLTVDILNSAWYDASVKRFVAERLSFENTQVIDKQVERKGSAKELRVVLVGREVPDSVIRLAQAHMPEYNLEGTQLVVLQGVSGGQKGMDITSVRSRLLEDFYKNGEQKLEQQAVAIDSLKRRLDSYVGYEQLAQALLPEVKVLYPQISRISLSRSLEMSVDSPRVDTLTYAVVNFSKKPDAAQLEKLTQWMKARTKAQHFKLLVEP